MKTNSHALLRSPRPSQVRAPALLALLAALSIAGGGCEYILGLQRAAAPRRRRRPRRHRDSQHRHRGHPRRHHGQRRQRHDEHRQQQQQQHDRERCSGSGDEQHGRRRRGHAYRRRGVGDGFPDTVGASLEPNPSGIAVDSQGNTFVTGSYQGTITFAPGAGGLVHGGGRRQLLSRELRADGRVSLGRVVQRHRHPGRVHPVERCRRWPGERLLGGGFLSKASVNVGSKTYHQPERKLRLNPRCIVRFDGHHRTLGRDVRQCHDDCLPDGDRRGLTGEVVITGTFDAPLTFGALPAIQSTGAAMFLAKLDGMSGDPAWSYGYGDVTGQPAGAQVPL